MLNLQAYRPQDLQKAKMILLQMIEKNLTPAQVVTQIEQLAADERVETLKVARRYRRKAVHAVQPPGKPCPDCRGIMRLVAADEQPGGEVVWQCQQCRYSEYTGKTFTQLTEGN